MELLNFATVLLIWVMGVQYLINNFLAPLIEKRASSADTGEKFIRVCQWTILFIFVIVIILASIGYLNTLKAN